MNEKRPGASVLRENALLTEAQAVPATVMVHPSPPRAWPRALAFLSRLLFSRRRDAADPLLEVLPEFDVEALLEEMRIQQKAAENGRYEIPATNDVQLDGPQALIVQRVEQAIREGKSHLETHLSNLTRRIQAIDVTQ